MFEYLDKLRRKKESTKHKIAISIAFIFSFTLFLLWLMIFLPDFEKKQAEENATQARFKSPSRNLIEMLSDSVMGVQETISDAKKHLNELSTTTAYYKASTTEISQDNTNNLSN